MLQGTNQDSMSWPSCHLWAARPGNTNAHLPRVNVSIETDEVCAGFGEYSAVECASLAFQAPAALGGKAVHTPGSVCFCLSRERGRASPVYVPTGVWGALDSGLHRLLHMFLTSASVFIAAAPGAIK